MKSRFLSVPDSVPKYLSEIGKILVVRYHRQLSYKAKNVIKVHRSTEWKENDEFQYWALCLYCSKKEFEFYLSTFGNIKLDYEAMRVLVFQSLSLPKNFRIDSILSEEHGLEKVNFDPLTIQVSVPKLNLKIRSLRFRDILDTIYNLLTIIDRFIN